MGRRRKHSGDSGLASDQFPGQNQNNIKYQALSLSAVPPPGLSQRYTGRLYPTRKAIASLTLDSIDHNLTILLSFGHLTCTSAPLNETKVMTCKLLEFQALF